MGSFRIVYASALVTLAVASSPCSSSGSSISCFSTNTKKKMPFFQGAVKESTMVPRQTEESISKPLNILRYRQDLTNDEENLTLQLVKAPTPFLTDDDSVLISSPTRQDEGILKERKKNGSASTLSTKSFT